ncbi:M23 family metallopeptidase [Ammoniphilus sp. 3BR4]
MKIADIIGNVGSTGSTTGLHLHFEIRENNRPVDPTPFYGVREV